MTIAAAVSAPGVSAPRRRLPPDACDAHSHVFGPLDRFPPVEVSRYALPDASLDVHARIRATLGIARGVLVQPAPYADDPSAILHALSQSNGALRGIAVATANAPDELLASWAAAGIVGLRFTEMRAPGGERYPGTVGFNAFRTLASRMREHGLHAQLWANAETLASELPDLVRLGVPLVLDHMGCPSLDHDSADPALKSILQVFRSENVWVKLAICRVSKRPLSFADVRTVHEAFIEAAADRCVWGSDWPYVRLSPAPDAGRLLDLFLEWTADATMQHRVLVDNPARLYGFGGKK